MVLPLLYWASYGANLEGAAGHAVLVASCTIGGKGGDLGFFLLLRFGFSRGLFSVEARDGVGERHVVARQAPRARLYRRRAPLQRGQVVRVRGRRRRRRRFRRAARLRDSRPETSLGAAGVGVACTEGVRDEAAGAGVFIADSILRLCSSRLRSSARNRCRATSPALLLEKASAMRAVLDGDGIAVAPPQSRK